MSKKAGHGGKKGNDVEQEVTLQAVVLADSFQNRFRPLTLDTPRCLLPLANVPLIEYTFEFLALAGVEDVFVFCTAHAEQIEAYIRNSKWNTAASSFRKLQVLVSPKSSSVGDAMREMDAKQLITADFLLVSGDIVSNLPLEPILEEHKKRRALDKNAIMTMILREASPKHRTKSREEQGVFLIDPVTKRCVHYEEMNPRAKKRHLAVPPELFKSHPLLDIRADLIDCYVDICSPDVPALFTENFDYQHIRRHFVHGILQDYELYGKTIHCHVATDHYAARVRSLQTYDAISRDIVSRWTYPLCPDSNNYSNQSYTYFRGNIYKEENVVLGRSCDVHSRTVIGAGTTIGDGTTVSESIIGRNCVIGENVTIEGAYIWDSVVIEDNCVVKNSIIANRAKIGQGARVEDTGIVSFNVELGPKAIATGRKRLTTHKRSQIDYDSEGEADSEDNDDEEEQGQSVADEAAVGSGGKGFFYVDTDSEDEDEPRVPDTIHPVQIEDDYLSDSSLSGFSSDEAAIAAKRRNRRASGGSFATSASEENDEDSWHREAVLSIRTALDKNHPVEIAGLEINGLRMASDATWHQVRKASASAFVARLDDLVEKGQTVVTACGQVFGRWHPLLTRMIHDRDDQVDFMLLFQKECSVRSKGSTLLLHTIQKLYDLDLMEEEAINMWWGDSRAVNDEGMVAVRKSTQAFITWLAEADEEDDDDDEEEESDSE